MSPILEALQGREIHPFTEGDLIIKEGTRTDCLFFLIRGTVEVVKNGVPVALASEPGVVFGEMAVLLGGGHTASVKAESACEFYIVENSSEFLKASPALCLHVCKLLAQRLDALNKYLVDVKRQFEGHDHLGMVDEVLETLLHRQPRNRVRPSDSTIRSGELPG